MTLDVFGDVAAECKALAEADPALARALDAIDKPVIRRRTGGFAGLFRIIVEQQVSVPSAQAIWGRCEAAFGAPEPALVREAGEAGLCDLGLSRPKARYVLGVASAVDAGDLDFSMVARANDADAAAHLLALKGVGPWTAAIYLLFCEGRVDIWPPKDVALLASWAAAAGFTEKPPMAALDETSDRWRPHRGLAAHILWTYYAHLRGRTPI